MSQNVPPDLISRARQILQPLVSTIDEREALLTEAFYSHDPLLYAIKREGAPKVFLVHCLKCLLDHGFLSETEHALARLLTIARVDCGVDKHAEIDELIEVANSLDRAAVLKESEPAPLHPDPAPVQTLATPRQERRPTVFISYSRTDAEFANKLIADLNSAGHACWIDTSSVKGGDEWIMTIADGILNSYAFVLITTQAALDSRWVQDEILWARKKNKQIIPLLLEDVTGETRFFPLTSYQGIACFDGNYAIALYKLLTSLPSPAMAPESAPRPHLDPRKAELAYLERLRLEELLNTEKYTPLAGSSQQQLPKRAEMKTVFELLPIGRELHAQREPKKFEDAVAEIRRMRRAVLLGEPGGGKTTTIWKLAADLVADAIADRKAPIPLLIRLGRWTDPEEPLKDFIASQLGDLGNSLDGLLQEKRAALLLDGLNELPAGQRDVKYPQVQDLIEEQPDLLAVVSCRELDYTVDLGFDRINITPLDPIRIREFVVRYLDGERGEALFWRLAGGNEVWALWETWQSAGASFELFWTAEDIPQENPNVYGATSGQQDNLWREKVRGKSSLMELARNPYMLLMLTSVYAEQNELPENRGELFRLFVEMLLKRERIPVDEHPPLTEGLAKVAYEMQIRRASDESGDALTVLPKEEVQAILGERLLYLAGSASILSVGEQVRFTHQLLQEYFAARFMDQEIRAGQLKATDLWPPEQWWERTNWEEAAILLAGLYSDDCSPIIEWIAEANPEVATMCAVRSGARLAEATAERLQSKWIPRLTDLKGDPEARARAAVGRALGLMRLDNRPGVGTIMDRHGIAIPDIDWVEVPAGEFQYGDESEYAAKPQKLILPTLYISRYPITFIQFQTFLDDSDGFADPRWFEGMAADDDGRRMGDQYFKFSNHPRECVNWYQAMAFCRWLSWRLGGETDLKKVANWSVRLPTEFEWEKAARGTDGRIYPYKGKYNVAKGNTEEIDRTTAVGIYPNGASPFGVMDMSGNVWEWCLSNYNGPAIEIQKENLATEDMRVLRGGSWANNQMFARAVYRYSNHPASRNFNIGFRVVCSVRPPSLLNP
jgi:formylglycine-generating enzyme required for sulfatase activity